MLLCTRSNVYTLWVRRRRQMQREKPVSVTKIFIARRKADVGRFLLKLYRICYEVIRMTRGKHEKIIALFCGGRVPIYL